MIEFQAISRACTWIALVPGISTCEQLKEPALKAAGVWPHLTDATPDNTSPTTPLTVTVEVFTTAPAAGDVTDTTGGVLSRLMMDVAGARLVARSVAACVICCPWPCVLTSTGSGHDATPDRESAHW